MSYVDFIRDLKFYGNTIRTIVYDLVNDIWIVTTSNMTHIYAMDETE